MKDEQVAGSPDPLDPRFGFRDGPEDVGQVRAPQGSRIRGASGLGYPPEDGPERDYYTAMKKKYLATGDKHVLVRQFVLDDPGYRQLISDELKRLTGPWVPFSSMSYYILKEPSLTCYGDAADICFSPYTPQGMRRWLRGLYGTLGALNRQWSTVSTHGTA